MSLQAEVDRLKAELAQLQQDTQRSRWIFRKAARKLFGFPFDTAARLQRSVKKRRKGAGSDTDHMPDLRAVKKVQTQAVPEGSVEPVKTPEISARIEKKPSKEPIALDVHVAPSWIPPMAALRFATGPAADAIADMHAFRKSDDFKDIINDAIALDPNIALVDFNQPGHLAPWYDEPYEGFRRALARLPQDPVTNVILMPFGKMGGADYVGGLLSKAVAGSGKTLILRTELPDWERPEWFDETIETVDLSGILTKMPDPVYGLYNILRYLNPKAIYNVNSRLCFDTLRDFGERLSVQSRLYAYYFCADYTEQGHEAGYPVWYMADVLPHLTAALCDTQFLRQSLIERYQIPGSMQNKLQALYTPFAEPVHDTPVVQTQIETADHRKRPKIIWAGRLDRQKRFDLVQDIARAMPDVDFYAWGKAVLDRPPKLSKLPQNLTLHKPFTRYDELPLTDCDGWLYTAAWDGLPTILIEVAGMGMPIVASAVGGVPELIDDDTGWLVQDADNVDAYISAITDMLADPEARIKRATAARDRVHTRHSAANYESALAKGVGT